MFKGQKAKNDTPNDDVETIIGPSVKIEGDFKSNGNVMVAGFISGTFSTTQNLRVEEQAKIVADVSADSAIVAGQIKGNLTIAGHLEILSSAIIEGDIKTGSISIQQGATMNGNCSMISSEVTATTANSEPVESAKPGEEPSSLEKKSKEQVTKDWLMAGEEEDTIKTD